MLKRIILFFVLFIPFCLPLISANFACGIVNDSESFSPSWMKVELYYTENPHFKTSCQVSPDGNKYCCDPREIKQVNWQIGKDLEARIFDKNSGYFSYPVSTEITGEGYDLFRNIELRKAIAIYSPQRNVFLNQTAIEFNLSIDPYFNSLRYELNHSGAITEAEICSNCNEAVFNLPVDLGNYEIKIIASNGDEELYEKLNLVNLEYIKLNRTVSCEKCLDELIPYDSEVNITITLETSHPVNGKLIDLYPSGWRLVDSFPRENVSRMSFSKTHNKVEWEVSGNNISRSYTLISPYIIFPIPRRNIFRSAFEDFSDDPDILKVYRFIATNILSTPPGDLSNETIELLGNEKYTYTSPGNPLVIDLNKKYLTQIAIFPNKILEEANANVLDGPEITFKGAEMNFAIESSIPSSEIDTVMIRYREKLDEHNGLFYYDGEWKLLDGVVYEEDENYRYYEAYNDNIGFFAIKRIDNE